MERPSDEFTGHDDGRGATETATIATVAATINAKATLLVSMGNGLPSTTVGCADVISTGSIGGFAMFRFMEPHVEALQEIDKRQRIVGGNVG